VTNFASIWRKGQPIVGVIALARTSSRSAVIDCCGRYEFSVGVLTPVIQPVDILLPEIYASAVRKILCLSALLPGLCVGQSFTGKVVGVSDGDTVMVLTSERRPMKVRMHGVDAPESAQPFGQASKRFLSNPAYGKRVVVHVKDKDRYGRSVAILKVAGRDVNLASVRAGMSWWYRRYAPLASDLQAAEEEARVAKRGIWSEPSPTPPWDWRNAARRSSSSRQSVSPAHSRSSQGQVVSEAVFVTATGTEYHRDGCRYLRRSRIRLTHKDARVSFDPCSVCRP